MCTKNHQTFTPLKDRGIIRTMCKRYLQKYLRKNNIDLTWLNPSTRSIFSILGMMIWIHFSCPDQYSNPLDTISAVNPCCSNLNSVVVDCGLSSSCASSPVARQSSGWAGRPTKFNSRKRWLFIKHTHTHS